jgi:hypothetical protein
MFNQQQTEEIIKRRQKIAANYCQEKGWSTNPTDLSFEQILEIRAQQEWKDVPMLVSEGK